MSRLASGPGYRTLLRLPGVPSFFLAALVGRLSYGIVGLALLLRVHGATGSYGDAGAALAAFGLANALLAPVRARFLDTYGLRRVLPLLAIGYAAALTTIAMVGSGAGWLIALSALAGVLPPPLGPTTRRVWSEIATEPALLRRAYSLDTVAEEALFTAGPLLAGLLAAAASPATVLVTSAGLVVLGTFGMVASPLTALPKATPHHLSRRPMSTASFRRLLLVVFGMWAALGFIDLPVVSLAQHHGGAATTGAILSCMSLGSAIGGTVYGARAWRHPPARQLPVVAGLIALGIAAMSVAPTLPLLTAGLFLTGLFVAPALIIGYSRADELSDPQTRTEAGTWVNSVGNLGGSAGTAVAGLLLDQSGSRPTLLVAAVVVAIASAVAAFGREVHEPMMTG
jgi:predicted MFS family arabinose efflux permease